MSKFQATLQQQNQFEHPKNRQPQSRHNDQSFAISDKTSCKMAKGMDVKDPKCKIKTHQHQYKTKKGVYLYFNNQKQDTPLQTGAAQTEKDADDWQF